MFPSYLKLTGLDSTHSRLAVKYHLYLYREQRSGNPQHELDSLDGVPVLFIPGNAGSYKQGRSIAAETAYNENNGIGFDFFMADFNEDFTAFHGRTLLDQAEYLNDAIRFILSLYSRKNNKVVPKSVIIVAHSMGGIVSRVMPTLPNYVEESLNSIITLATPHAAAPATFDGDIMSIYSSADKFWRSAYFDSMDSIADQRLANVSVISITGGYLDQILPADYTTLQGVVPMTNGFTVYTTTIPQVWTPIDHLAIVWCDQLRKKISQSLYDIADISTPFKTKSLDERMRVFKKYFLSGFEEYAIDTYNQETVLNLEKTDFMEFKPTGEYHKVSVNETFSLLSNVDSLVYACNMRANGSKVDSYSCLEIPTNVVPNSESPENSLQLSSAGGSINPFHGLVLSPKILQDYSHLIFKEPQSPTDFITFSPTTSTSIDFSIFRLLFGTNIKINKGSLVTDISITNAWSSLIVFELSPIDISEEPRFSPFIRQYISDPFESKWHLQLKKPKLISFHGIAPYTPFVSKSNLHLEVWKPITEELSFSLKINIFKSLKSLLLRYRLTVATFPIFIVTAVLFLQFNTFFRTSKFPDFEQSLNYLCSKSPIVMIILSLLSILSSNPIFKYLFYLVDPIAQNNPLKLPNVNLNPYFLGLEEKFLWILAPFFCIIMTTLVFTLYHIIFLILSIALRISKYFTVAKRTKLISQRETFLSRAQMLGSILLAVLVNFYFPYQFAVIVCTITQSVITIKSYIKSQELSNLNLSKNSSSSSDEEKPPSASNISFFNYNLSILILMLCLIPVNVPILIVFFHNMLIRWTTPFTSHHNILAILPIILLTLNHISYKEKFLDLLADVPRSLKTDQNDIFKVRKFITLLLLGWFSWFSLIYGVRSLYYLHYFFNLLCAWLVVSSYWSRPRKLAS